MNEPVVSGPAAFNLNHPEPFSWKSAVSGWLFTVAGAGDAHCDGQYAAEDAEIGWYRHTGRGDRALNFLGYSGMNNWCLGAARVTSMPGLYYKAGTLADGPADGPWSVGSGPGPAPAVTKAPNVLSGVFRFQVVEDGAEADPDGWSEPSEELSFTPEGLEAGDYRLLVQEQVGDDEWTGAGAFAFSASAYLLPAPVIDGPPLVNGTRAAFAWRTGNPGGWTFTVTGAGDPSYDGVYPAQNAARGVYVHRDRGDRFLYSHPDYPEYWSMASRYYESMPGAYFCPGTLAGGPAGTWSASYGPAPVVTREDLAGLTGLYQWRIAAGETPGPDEWSEASADTAVERTGLVPGEYRLFVREHVAGDEWTETAAFAFAVVFSPIAAPVVSGATPTDDFTPTLSVRSGAPGPGRFLVLGAGTAEANGVYAPAGVVNGFPYFKKAGADVYCWNVPDYGARKWIVYELANPPVAATGTAHSGGYWYSASVGGDRPPATDWSRGEGAANAPTLQFGTYPEGGGAGAFQFRVDGGGWSESFAEASFTLPGQASGVHAVEVREMGENGLWSQGAAFNVETSLIPAPTVAGPAESDGGWHIIFTWASTSGHRGTRVFHYRINGGPWSPEKAGTVNNNTATTVAQLLEGHNLFEVEEKSVTGGWSATGAHEVQAVNALSGGSHLPIPPGSRIVAVDPAGREYLWGPEAGQLSRQYALRLMAPPDPSRAPSNEVRYLFVTSTDRYHLPSCVHAATGIPLTVAELAARAAVPCAKCNPPALS